ncbi:MAG: hypothetical protein WBG73_18580 [Coleofasciculaceae cyanobacterium]
MGSTIFWGIIVFIALMLILFFGYKIWRRTKPTKSRRRSHNRTTADAYRQNEQPEPGNSADAATQLGHSLKRNSTDARTISRPSQNPHLEDAQTKIRQDQKDEQPQLEPPPNLNSADAPTQIGRQQNNNIDPEDNRTKI